VRIHLVDGTYELFRAYFGAPKATGTNGLEVGATRGILWSMLSLLREDRVTHVACAFESRHRVVRNELFAGYKSSEGVPEDLLAQFSMAERATHALGLITWPMVEFEADDALATAAARWADEMEVEQIVICTPDKDMAQCVRDSRIVCMDRMRRKLIDQIAVIEKYGVPPRSIPDWLALVETAPTATPAWHGGREVGGHRARALRTSGSHSRSRARLGTRRTGRVRARDQPARSPGRGVPVSPTRNTADRYAAHRDTRRSAMAWRETRGIDGPLSRTWQPGLP
jgi:hypothetical protein